MFRISFNLTLEGVLPWRRRARRRRPRPSGTEIIGLIVNTIAALATIVGLLMGG